MYAKFLGGGSVLSLTIMLCGVDMELNKLGLLKLSEFVSSMLL